MAGMIPFSTRVRPFCPMDDDAEHLQDDTSVPQSSLKGENCKFMEKKHPNRLMEGLDRLRLNNTFCDVVLCCGGEAFPCHRIVLSSFSPYFEAMFTTGMVESRQERVNMFGVEPQIIDLLLSFAYTSKVVISTENVQALLAAANLLGVTAVLEACCQYLEHHMDEKNCVGIHCFAEAHSCKMLEKHSMNYILEHFSLVYQQKEFLSLGVDKLTEIIASDDINVINEEMLFEAAMLWLEHCPTNRQSFEKVMEHIRLAHIRPSYLLEVTASLSVLESQACHRFLSNAEAKELKPRRSTVCEVILTVAERVAGGGDKPLHRIESYDPLTGRWKTLACLPIAVIDHGLAVSGPFVYLAGGDFPDGSLSNEVWRYDSSSDSWSKMAPMNEARGDVGLVTLDGYVFAVGGWNGKTYVNSVERYDPKTNSWQLLEASIGRVPISADCNNPAVVALDGLIYFLDECQVYKYDPKTSEWTEVASMLVPRTGKAVCTLTGKIYVIGGMPLFGSSFTDEVECYNPETDEWTMCGSTEVERYGPGVAVVDGKIYVLEGAECSRSPIHDVWYPLHRTIERYIEATDTWDIVGEMPAGINLFSCVSLTMRKDAHQEESTEGQKGRGQKAASASTEAATDTTGAGWQTLADSLETESHWNLSTPA